MSWPTRTSISPPWLAPLELVQRGNAEGNARSTECSPVARKVCGGRGEHTSRVVRRPGACNRAAHWDLRCVATGGGFCRPESGASTARGAATQRGRERPPSEVRQVPCRLTPEGRSRPRPASVHVRVMRPVMPPAQRPDMMPVFPLSIRAPRARCACGAETGLPPAKEPLCL